MFLPHDCLNIAQLLLPLFSDMPSHLLDEFEQLHGTLLIGYKAAYLPDHVPYEPAVHVLGEASLLTFFITLWPSLRPTASSTRPWLLSLNYFRIEANLESQKLQKEGTTCLQFMEEVLKVF